MIQFAKLPILPSQFIAPVIILILTIFGFLFDNQLSQYLEYNRESILNHQQFWRFFTGHLLHTNYAHFLLNTLALVLLWALHGQFYSIPHFISLFLFSALVISSALFFFTPEMNQYVGLSGVLHAVYIWGALKDIENKDKSGYLLLIGGIVKVAHEQIYGASEDVANLINATVAIDAHLWGINSGIIFFIISIAINRNKKTSNK